MRSAPGKGPTTGYTSKSRVGWTGVRAFRAQGRHLAEGRIPHLEGAVLEELDRVRQELGWPIVMTPFAQMVITQAVMNVTGGRYNTIPDEVIRYAIGRFGRPMPAVGFMLGLDRLALLLDRQGAFPQSQPPEARSVQGAALGSSLPEGRRAPFSYELRLLDGSGRTTVLQRLQLSSMSPGLGVSPDGKSLLIAGVTEIGQDLFRIDNFR